MAAFRKAFGDALIKAAKADKNLAGASITTRFTDRAHQSFLDTLTKQVHTTGRVAIPGFGIFSIACVLAPPR